MPRQPANDESCGSTDRRGPGLTSKQGEGVIAKNFRRRRSTKSYAAESIDVATVSRLLGEAIGADSRNRRPYASAHARYDVSFTLIAGSVNGLSPGVYRYSAQSHSLDQVGEGDHRAVLAEGTLDAEWLSECPLIMVLTADFTSANVAFEAQEVGRGERFCWFEAGLAAQTIYLWAADNQLATAFIGGFDSTETRSAMRGWIPTSHSVLGLMPIGYPAG